jgi:predicted glycosyltransferase
MNINGHRFILITAGGGGDGARLIETSLKAMDKFNDIPFKSLVVLGPDFPTARGKKIRSLYSRCKNILITNFVTHLQDFINASDLVISMGGYNTVCEILSLKKRAIIVPRVQPRVEQLIRAKKLSGNGLFEYIHPERLNPYILRERIKYTFSNGRHFNSTIDLGGLRRSSEVFNEYLSS